MNEEDYQPSNREKAKQAKYGWFWCWGCDAQLVSDGRKCPNCGKKMNDKKIKYDKNRSSFNT